MGIVAAIGGALIQGAAARKAAKAQTAAANQDIAFQKETRDIVRNDLATYRSGGESAQRGLDFELGLGARPEGYGGYTKTPGFDFRMSEGRDAIEAGAAGRGGLYSGAAMRDLEKYRQDYSTNEYGDYLSRLGARADTGMGAAQMSGEASRQAAAGVSSALGDRGNAQAGGYIGVGNALVGGIQNGLSAWQYQKNLATQPQYGGGR